MALLSLPNELLGRIVAETMPEGFENFVLSCKAVYHATGALMEKYNTMRRRWRHFSFRGQGDLSNPDDCASSPQLIARIAADPLISRYIVTADLKEDSTLEHDDNIEALVQVLETSWEVRSLFDDSPYLKEAGIDPSIALRYVTEQCATDLEVKDYGLAATLLLSMLPNVTKLALSKNWKQWESERNSRGRRVDIPWNLSRFLEVIVTRANDPSDPTAGLSNLTTFWPSTAWGYQNRWRLSTFTPFLSIKSLRSFCSGSCRAIDDGYTGAPFNIPTYKTFGHGLEILELVGAVVDGKELLKLLCRLPCLRIFRLSYETKWHGCGHDFRAGDAMTAIEDAVGNQLEELSFSILNCYGAIEPRVVSMKKFTRLKNLELDLAVLPFHDLDTDLPHLPDILPSSVESLVLLVGNIEDHASFFDLIPDQAAEIAKKLPQLKQIIIRSMARSQHNDHSTDTQEEAAEKQEWKAKVMALEPFMEVEFDEVNDDTLAQFTENFCNRFGVETM